LEHHFWQEEHVLLKKKNNTNNLSKYISQMLDEHKQIRELIFKIDNNNSKTKLIAEFAELLNKHIRFEERELFPLLQKESSADDLEEIGKFLKQHHNHSCEVWPNQFWKN